MNASESTKQCTNQIWSVAMVEDGYQNKTTNKCRIYRLCIVDLHRRIMTARHRQYHLCRK